MSLLRLSYIDVFDENKEKTIEFDPYLYKKDVKKESLFALLLDGQSMQPFIKDRSVVIIDLSNKSLEDKQCYLLRFDNKMWLKQYDKKSESFISINKKFSHLIYKKDEVSLIGTLFCFFQG